MAITKIKYGIPALYFQLSFENLLLALGDGHMAINGLSPAGKTYVSAWVSEHSRPDLSLELHVSRIPFGISLAREERYFKPCASRILCRATGEYSRLGAPLTGSFKYRDSTVNLALRKDVSQPTGSRHRQRRVFSVRFASGNTEEARGLIEKL